MVIGVIFLGWFGMSFSLVCFPKIGLCCPDGKYKFGKKVLELVRLLAVDLEGICECEPFFG